MPLDRRVVEPGVHSERDGRIAVTEQTRHLNGRHLWKREGERGATVPEVVTANRFTPLPVQPGLAGSRRHRTEDVAPVYRFAVLRLEDERAGPDAAEAEYGLPGPVSAELVGENGKERDVGRTARLADMGGRPTWELCEAGRCGAC
jgi:hypothetical protein